MYDLLILPAVKLSFQKDNTQRGLKFDTKKYIISYQQEVK
jgi:hypothetical protein